MANRRTHAMSTRTTSSTIPPTLPPIALSSSRLKSFPLPPDQTTAVATMRCTPCCWCCWTQRSWSLNRKSIASSTWSRSKRAANRRPVTRYSGGNPRIQALEGRHVQSTAPLTGERLARAAMGVMPPAPPPPTGNLIVDIVRSFAGWKCAALFPVKVKRVGGEDTNE